MQGSFAEEKEVAKESGIPDIPDVMPAPSLDILSNYDAMEAEGVKLLNEDPTNFFVFDNSNTEADTKNKKKNKNKNKKDDKTTTLGKPIRLIDPLRDTSPTQTPFPQIIGRLPKPDTRTEREKKKDEKERRMWAAAQEELASGIEFAAEEEKLYSAGGKDVDYDELGNRGDDADLEWEEGLDPETEGDILSTPRERRYTEEDVDWIIGKLEEKISIREEIEKMNDESGGKEIDAAAKEKDEDIRIADYFDDDDMSRALGGKGGAVKMKKHDIVESDSTTYSVATNLQDLVDTSRIDSVLSNLDEKQMEALQSLDTSGAAMSAEEIRAALTKVPGLSNDQVDTLVELELSLSSNDELMKELAKEE